MAKYDLTLPAGINDFTYGTNSSGDPVTYHAGNSYHTDNPCHALGFYNAARGTNPELGRADETPGFWAGVDAACQAQQAAPPPTPPPLPPVESNPADAGGDSGTNQGAPPPPDGGNATGTTTTTPSDGGTAVTNPPPTEEDTRPPADEPHPTHGGEIPHDPTDAGDPVDIFSGSFSLEETDLSIPNTMLPLAFTRFYRSGAASFGPFGWNWDHNFNIFLRERSTGDVLLWRMLHEVTFKFDGLNYEPQRGIFEKLEPVIGVPHVYELKAAAGIITRFERPAGWIDAERIPVRWIKDRHGNQLTFTYGVEDKLQEVRDDDNRFFKFDYDQCGLMVAVSDHAGRKFTYDHDEQTMQLIRVTSPATSDFPNGTARNYHYEQPWTFPQLRHNILRVEDGDGNVYLENSYEQDPASLSYARVTEQWYGGFLFQFQYTQLQWVPADSLFINIPALRVEVMNPDFGLETYTFNYRGDLLDRRYRLSKDKSYRVVVWQYEFDDQGNLSKTTRPDGSEEISVFDFANPDPRMRGKLLQKEVTAASGFPAPSRIIWKGKYDSVFQLLTEEKNESGAVTKYKYDFDLTPPAPTNSGKLMQVINPDATWPDGTIQQSKTTFEYNIKGQVTAEVLPDNTRNEMTYGVVGNDASRLVQQTMDVGNLGVVCSMKYDLFGFKSDKTDGNGNTTHQTYNALGLLEKIILPAINGNTAEHLFKYNTDKKLISLGRPKGSFTDSTITGNHIVDEFERDVLGFPVEYNVSANTAEAKTVMLTNNYRGLPLETENPDGSKVRTTYDERGLLLKEQLMGVDGKKLTRKKVYDRTGKLIEDTNIAGLTTHYQYDGFSRLVRTTLPNGTVIRYTWFANDLLQSEETTGDDGTGLIRQLTFKSYAYDEKNRRIAESVKTFSDNPAVFTLVTTTLFYDVLDRVEKLVTSRGGINIRQYDGLGRLVLTRDALGNEEHFGYDNNGNNVTIQSRHLEPDGSFSTIVKDFQYDARNRRIAMVEPDGVRVISEYDDRNLLIKQSDQANTTKVMDYDSFSIKRSEIHDPTGLHIHKQWTIDNMSRISAFIDPMRETSNYQYDSLGNNIGIDFPNGFSSTKTFNNLNLLTHERLGSGSEFVYTYDVANRLIKIENTVFPLPVVKVADHEFKYDGLDRIVEAKAGASTIRRKYDSQSRLQEEASFGNTLSCTYDDVAGSVEKTWPDGRKEKFYHDLNDILTKVEQINNGALGSGNTILASFKPSGRNFFGTADFNGRFTLENTYDDRKRITSIQAANSNGLQETVHYRYNAANRRQVEAITGSNSKMSFFEFDAKHRLKNSYDGFSAPIATVVSQPEHDASIVTMQASALVGPHLENFDYDMSDARTKYGETATPDRNYLYLPGHRIQHDGLNPHAYLTDGTLASNGALNYEADALGRITKVRTGATVALEIVYDALGRPGVLKESGKPDRSLNYFGGFVEQESEAGAAVRQITNHPLTGIPIAYHVSSGTHYPVFDNRFNLLALLDNQGDLLETFRYKAFGLPQVYDNAGLPIAASSLGIEPIFGGQRFLKDIGLYLSKKRLMNPVNGAYLAPDPKGYLDSSSLYVYCGQDPVNNIDPNGEIIPFIIGAFVIGGALAGAGYSIYDAYEHPDRYEGWQGSLRVLGNVFGGAAIGGLAVVGGELVLAAGGTGIFATGTGAAATLTATQTFVLYGTSSAVTGSILRGGFNNMFPEYVDPVTAGTIATDYVAGGAFGVLFRGLGLLEPPVPGVRAAVPPPAPTTVPNGTLGAGVNGVTTPGMTLVPEAGWLGKLGLSRPVFNPTVDVVANPVGSTYANVVKHELQHASDMLNYPQLSYLANYSRLPGRGLAALWMETRGYFAEFGMQGLLPNYAWRSLTNRVAGPVTERGYLLAEILALSALASLPWLMNSSNPNSSHPNEKPPAAK